MKDLMIQVSDHLYKMIEALSESINIGDLLANWVAGTLTLPLDGRAVTPPSLLGRSRSWYLDARAGTREVGGAEIEYTSGAVGYARVTCFASNDDEDRGGFVVRIEIEDHGCSFLPYAVPHEKGVDLHLCGEAEGEAVLRLLREVRNPVVTETVYSSFHAWEGARSASGKTPPIGETK